MPSPRLGRPEGTHAPANRGRRKRRSRVPAVPDYSVVSVEDKIVNTTVSINLHGLEGAWQKAVEFYAEHKKINKRSKAWKALLGARPSEAELKKLMRRAARRRAR